MRTCLVKFAVASVWLCLVTSAWAVERPAFNNNLRYEEDSAAYRDVEPANALDQIKFIPLNEAETVFLSLGGQVRARWENWSNFNFDPSQDDDFGLLRLRLHGDLHLGEQFRVFVEGKSALATDRDLPGGRRTVDVDEWDLQNAFVDVRLPLGGWTATLRLGRQELAYGAQRLVSPLDWANTRRTWDGGRLILQNDAWRIDAFATRPVVVEKYEFNEWNKDQEFYGLYATHALPDWALKYDVYILRLDRDGVASGDEERYTVGLRLAGKCPLTGVEYDVEGGPQFGDAGDKDIEAWFIASELAYSFEDTTMQPRISLGYDYASGDNDPDDNKEKTFNQLYPLGHAYFGFIDAIGRQNIMDISQGVSFWPIEKKLQIRLDHHFFYRAERADAVYNAGGGVLRPGDADAGREIGTELDLTVMCRINRNTTAWVGYSRFWAGDFLKETGPSSDTDFAYGSVQYTF